MTKTATFTNTCWDICFCISDNIVIKKERKRKKKYSGREQGIVEEIF